MYKVDSKKTHPLVISSPRDKIVQKAVELLLTEIYERKEKYFLDCSHGFRPNRSGHTALRVIKKSWNALP